MCTQTIYIAFEKEYLLLSKYLSKIIAITLTKYHPYLPKDILFLPTLTTVD
jgi:hypothetical protein